VVAQPDVVAYPDAIGQPHPVAAPEPFTGVGCSDRLWSGVIDDIASIQPLAFRASARIQRAVSRARAQTTEISRCPVTRHGTGLPDLLVQDIREFFVSLM